MVSLQFILHENLCKYPNKLALENNASYGQNFPCRASGKTGKVNPLGVKGAGEAGAIPVGPLFAQALEDALHDVDFEILEIPLNSNRLWELVSGK